MLDRIRTYDLWLRKPTLYPTELRAHMWTFPPKREYPLEMKMSIAELATPILYHKTFCDTIVLLWKVRKNLTLDRNVLV